MNFDNFSDSKMDNRKNFFFNKQQHIDNNIKVQGIIK